MQSAFEEWEHERERLLAHSRALEASAQEKLQHAKLRLSEALNQLEATQRGAHAVRVQLEAKVQAARARAREVQEAFTASQAAAEQLRIANAELSTALEATQWRLGELEAERAALQEREATLQGRVEAMREAQLHAAEDAAALTARIEGSEADLLSAHEQRQQLEQQLAAAHTERSALEDEIQRLRAAHAGELAATQQAATQRESELLAARDALAHELATEQQHAQNARDGATALAARIDSIEAALHAAHEQRQQLEQQLAAAHTERSALEDEIPRLRAAHAGELAAAQQAATQRESELLAARDALAHGLATEQQHAQNARDGATALAARIDSTEAALHAAHEQRQQLEQQLAAAHTERSTLADEIPRLRAAHAEELGAAQEAAAQRESELLAARDALTHHLAEEQLQARSARDAAAALTARLEGIEKDFHAAHEQRREVEQQLTATQTERNALEDELHRLRAAHADELATSQQGAAQRETELLGARDALAHQLAEEQQQVRSARDGATALAARIDNIEAALRTAHEQRQQLEQQLAAAQNERSASETALAQLRATQVDELNAWQQRVAEQQFDRDALANRVQVLEDELRQRDASIEHLRADLAHLEERQAQALQTATEATRRREEEWRASHRTLREELDSMRRNLADVDAARQAAQQRGQVLEAQLQQQALELGEAREQARAAATLAQQTAEGGASTTQLEERCATLLQELDDLRNQSALTQQHHQAMTARVAELENERSTVALRVDELTALTGQLERECDRLRRDRGSSEDTRRLKAENARLEAKIIELDRQRAEAVRRHSAAVAGYMVELTQRSEALHARETELQKLTEEVELLRRSCEDAVSELSGQRRQQEALEREISALRAGPGQSPAPTSAPAVSPAPP
ncbi:MAG TPA: hypothetical protein VMW56_04430, partial [Candidatus Margulisiibacteriota bacterium]|nr:hypothetical protein [Candidatus Margulisiibacteriota bacterium]